MLSKFLSFTEGPIRPATDALEKVVGQVSLRIFEQYTIQYTVDEVLARLTVHVFLCFYDVLHEGVSLVLNIVPHVK